MKKKKLLIKFLQHLDDKLGIGYDMNFVEESEHFLQKLKDEKGAFGLSKKRDLTKQMIFDIEDKFLNAGFIIRGKSIPIVDCTVSKNAKNSPDVATITIFDGSLNVHTHLSYFTNRVLLSKMVEPELTAQQIYGYLLESLDAIKLKIG